MNALALPVSDWSTSEVRTYDLRKQFAAEDRSARYSVEDRRTTDGERLEYRVVKEPTAARPVDSRPRVSYTLPDGTDALIIFDHGAVVPSTISFMPKGATAAIEIPLSNRYTGPRVLPL